MARTPTQLQKALDKAERYLAVTMYRAIVGLEDHEAFNSAELKRIEFVSCYGPDAAIDHLYLEAARYEDM